MRRIEHNLTLAGIYTHSPWQGMCRVWWDARPISISPALNGVRTAEPPRIGFIVPVWAVQFFRGGYCNVDFVTCRLILYRAGCRMVHVLNSLRDKLSLAVDHRTLGLWWVGMRGLLDFGRRTRLERTLSAR